MCVYFAHQNFPKWSEPREREKEWTRGCDSTSPLPLYVCMRWRRLRTILYTTMFGDSNRATIKKSRPALAKRIVAENCSLVTAENVKISFPNIIHNFNIRNGNVLFSLALHYTKTPCVCFASSIPSVNLSRPELDAWLCVPHRTVAASYWYHSPNGIEEKQPTIRIDADVISDTSVFSLDGKIVNRIDVKCAIQTKRKSFVDWHSIHQHISE